jgi:hypothetical protein
MKIVCSQTRPVNIQLPGFAPKELAMAHETVWRSEYSNGMARDTQDRPRDRDIAERGAALSARYKRHPPRATELDPFKDYVIRRLNGGAGAAATERAANRAARVGYPDGYA